MGNELAIKLFAGMSANETTWEAFCLQLVQGVPHILQYVDQGHTSFPYQGGTATMEFIVTRQALIHTAQVVPSKSRLLYM